MGEVFVLFAASVTLAFVGSLLWRKTQRRGTRLLGAIVLGPTVAGFSGILFHLGTTIVELAQPMLGLASPVSDSALWEWLRYVCVAAFLPLIVAMVVIILFAVVSGLGPEAVATHFMDGDHMDVFLTGSDLSDACGCLTAALILLGPMAYGLFFGGYGFVLGSLARLSGVDFLQLQDPLSATSFALVIWAGSIFNAVQRSR